MTKSNLAVLAMAAAVMLPASATDTSSLGAFAASCASDSKGCRAVAMGAILSAHNAKYGCIPKETSNEDAADRLLGWLRYTATRDSKYANEPLSDLMWTGIDEIWPCKK